jgi:hypothetical protein
VKWRSATATRSRSKSWAGSPRAPRSSFTRRTRSPKGCVSRRDKPAAAGAGSGEERPQARRP